MTTASRISTSSQPGNSSFFRRSGVWLCKTHTDRRGRTWDGLGATLRKPRRFNALDGIRGSGLRVRKGGGCVRGYCAL
jgi:hypothetical protein